MEWVDGVKSSDAEGMRALGLRPRDVGVLLLDVFAQMTYVNGLVHGDAHPGNVLIRGAPQQGEGAWRVACGQGLRRLVDRLDDCAIRFATTEQAFIRMSADLHAECVYLA